MTEELTLQTLIDKVKTDLFSPYKGTEHEGKIVYPIFLVESVELELVVNISYEAGGGVKVTIPQIIESSLEAKQTAGQSHTLKVKLSPILTRDELRAQMQTDTRLWEGIVKASEPVLRRGTQLAGEEE